MTTNKAGGREFQFLGWRSHSPKRRQQRRRARKVHDPMLVLNMSMFNYAGGWNRVLRRAQVNGI